MGLVEDNSVPHLQGKLMLALGGTAWDLERME